METKLLKALAHANNLHKTAHHTINA
uniref:Uncharacterized protein n=1 Tax=Anguilla anguilla TaxID=7936 RepID=A0A0E9SSC5_ANGAN